jgi:magnesium transporter
VLNIYRTNDARELEKIETEVDGAWINLVDPTMDECETIAKKFNIDLGDLRAPLDSEERSRIEFEDGYTLILVDIPVIEVRNGKDWFETIPLGIIKTDEAIITTCLQESNVIGAFVREQIREFYTFKKSRFIYQILYRNAQVYLGYLKTIQKKSDLVEKKLHESTKNKELLELLELEKSLVYFDTSLHANERVLVKLNRSDDVRKYPEDEELLEDVIVENQQALEMTNIYENVLTSTIDIYASVIANNQNTIMKLLAIWTIVMSVPTMIFSAYGMNVETNFMPFAHANHGFWLIVIFSALISCSLLIYFFKKKFF